MATTMCFRLIGLLLLTSTFAQSLLAQSTNPQPNPQIAELLPLEVRVGLASYNDSKQERKDLADTLLEIERKLRKGDRQIRFKVEVGNYDEVLYWYRENQLDVAIMNPGPLAVLLDEYGREALTPAFIGTKVLKPPKNSFTRASTTTPRDKYKSLMVVNKCVPKQLKLDANSPLDAQQEKSVTDFIFQKARQNQVQFLFVHPLSTSGGILPQKILKDAGVKLESMKPTYTYSHDKSVHEVNESDCTNLKVAFVWDETANSQADKVVAIHSGPFEQDIIRDGIILNLDFMDRLEREGHSAENKSADLQRVKNILSAYKTCESSKDRDTQSNPAQCQASTYEHPDRQSVQATTPWWKDMETVLGWINYIGGRDKLNTVMVDIDHIITRLGTYNKYSEKPARLAIVLSGGGAKCAYQLGAMGIIEDKLRAAAKDDPKLGIHLVVGTSGGAVNALAVAAEVTADAVGREKLKKTMESFSQPEILRPSNFVRRVFGIAFGLLFSFVLILAIDGLQTRQPRKLSTVKLSGNEPPVLRRLEAVRNLWSRLGRLDPVAILLILIALGLLIATLLFRLGTTRVINLWDVQRLLSVHGVIHFVEYSRQLFRWTSFTILVCGVLRGLYIWFIQEKTKRQRQKWRLAIMAPASVIIFLLPPLALLASVLCQKSVFVSDGIEAKIKTEMPSILGLKVDNETLQEISKKIIAEGRIKRDLLITGSVLREENDGALQGTKKNSSIMENPGSSANAFYFYYQAKGSEQLPASLRSDESFVLLRQNDSILLDAVIGSGAIFPVFQSKTLTNVLSVKRTYQNVEIVDGGFGHNSPIEAAIKLQATHVIVIEASPLSKPTGGDNLWQNTFAAFNHLFTQAQQLDVRSRRMAEIFTLRPTVRKDGDRYLCTVDFGARFIDDAYDLGCENAGDRENPKFLREPRPFGLN
jgi:predicted acylesterase/phospholipase RssA/ABC-type phosphate/phosphonate transport system substrate-binding protein